MRNPAADDGAAIREFLSSLADALAGSAEPPVKAMETRIRGAVDAAGADMDRMPRRLPACSYLPAAIATARAASGAIARLMDAFAALEPQLCWYCRTTTGPHASDNWADGHANAVIIGPNGVRSRPGLQIGISLLAPHVRYPDHSHPPEEVYLALSSGRFQHGTAPWFEPGIGGTFHNVPNITHAMASGAAPFLAIWCLWSAGASRH
ncbi:dimethylsulfonioproprionate lyase family protein [Hypericibacter adhaerens]|nr:dimethylsulfonioproprionate lyase family protein [Hypericibacter adhaerens]